MDRKEFLKDCGRMGFAGWMLSLFPWLESCSEATRREVQGEKARIGIIGTGSRGLFHIQHLLQMPQVEVTAAVAGMPAASSRGGFTAMMYAIARKVVRPARSS